MSIFTRIFTVIFLLQYVFVVRPAQAEEVVRVVSLGDSYTAGNGGGEYYGRKGCYRSKNNYVEQLIKVSGIATKYLNLSCSNAVASDIPKQIQENPGYVKNSDAVFLTVGGNDADFAKIVVECVVAEAAFAHMCVDRLERSWAHIDSWVDKTISTLHKIAKQAPKAKIYLVGYPMLMADCDYKVYLKDERGLYDYNVSHQIRTLQAFYDGKIENAVKKLNNKRINFVSILRDFDDHHMYCGKKEKWFVDVLGSGLPAEYFHPNTKGHGFIAQRLNNLKILNQLNKSVNKSPKKPKKKAPKQSPPGKAKGFTNLPFECGYVVRHATTYDKFPYNGKTYYHGHALDFPVKAGTKVTAPISGRIRVGWDPSGYGRYIDLVRGNEVHRLAHLNKRVKVSNNQKVAKGTVIGLVGTTGATTGPHLHYEVIKNGKSVGVNLGAKLKWGARYSSYGDRKTTHSLKSANCRTKGKSSAPFKLFAGDEVKVSVDSRSRIVAINRNGKVQPLVSGIMKPSHRVECDRNADGRDEVYSLERRGGKSYVMRFVLNKKGQTSWHEFFRTNKKITALSCGNYWGNRSDEVKIHLKNGQIREIKTHKSTKLIYKGIQSPDYRVECDTNRDGRDEIYSLEKTKKGYRLMQAYYVNGERVWRRYVPDHRLNGRKVLAMSCGNSNGDGRDELKFYFKDSRDIEMINPHSSYKNRKFKVAFRHITPAVFMVECDANNDGRDKIFYIEKRNGSFYLMSGDYHRRVWAHVKRFKSKVMFLSCGNFDGR